MDTVIDGLRVIGSSTFVLKDAPSQSTVTVKLPNKHTAAGVVVGSELVFGLETSVAKGDEPPRIVWKSDPENRIRIEILRSAEWPGLASGLNGMESPARIGRAAPYEVFFQVVYAPVAAATLVHFTALVRGTDGE